MLILKTMPMPLMVLLACMGAGFSVIADLFSGFSPEATIKSVFISIQDIKTFGTAKSLAQLEIGQYIIFISIPMSSLVIFPIYQGIKNSKLKLAKIFFVLSFVLSCFLGLAFHTMITMLSFVFIKEQQGLWMLSSIEFQFLTNLFNVVVHVMIVASLFSNICFALIVFQSQTIFSKASAIISPILITATMLLVSLVLPAPYSVFFYIVSGNLGLLIWYVLLFGCFVNKSPKKIFQAAQAPLPELHLTKVY